MYTQLGVLTKGTIIEVNVSELGLVTAGGKVVWGRYARMSPPTLQTLYAMQRSNSVCVSIEITNNPENDGCLNAVLLV
jgi:ribosome biogenesis protein NSA2